MPRTTALLLGVSLLCVSCNQSAIDPSESLVGVKRLPSAGELSGERIEIYFGYNKELTRQLSYELAPDDSWTVRISEVGDFEKATRQKFQLSPTLARQVRKQLWRVRPAELNGLEWLTRPADCPPPPTDTSSMLSIGFIAERPKPGIEDDKVGVFDLPHTYTCNTRQAIAARKLLDQVMSSLPRSDLRQTYRYISPLP